MKKKKRRGKKSVLDKNNGDGLKLQQIFEVSIYTTTKRESLMMMRVPPPLGP
jgi:hypothetical protein